MSETKISTLPAAVHLADGRHLDLEVINPDMVRWDITAAKHKWPRMDEAPMLWATFVTWRAAVRTGQYAGTWEDWSNTDAVQVHLQMDTKAAAVEVDPTP